MSSAPWPNLEAMVVLRTAGKIQSLNQPLGVSRGSVLVNAKTRPNGLRLDEFQC